METSFESKQYELADRLAMLPLASAAVFITACAERLSPFYAYFSKEERWGDYGSLRKSMEFLWQSLLGQQYTEHLRDSLSDVERLVPHSDDFPTPAGLLAQDVAICLDLGIRASLQMSVVGAHVIQYSFEGLQAIVTFRQNGHLYVCDPRERSAVDAQLLKEPIILHEVGAQESDLDALEGCQHVSRALVEQIRLRAVAMRHDADVILGGRERGIR